MTYLKSGSLLRLALSAALVLPAIARQRDPLKLDPENPHYLFFRGRTTVLVTSGEHYGAVINSQFDYRTYLAELHRNHLNLTRVFVGSYLEIDKPFDPAKGGYSIDRNTLAPDSSHFVAPWARVGNKFDLSRWNPTYFARLHDFLSLARKYGIVVELTLFCLMYDQSLWEASPLNARNNVNGLEAVPNTEVYNLRSSKLQAAQDALGRKIVAEAQPFDNVYFEIINEPYWHSVTPEWQRHISSLIVETESRLGVRHLISQNYAQFSARIENPDPNVSLFNFHYSRPPDSVAMNYDLKRAIGVNETGFDGASDAAYRIQGWDFLTAGGTLYNNLDFSFASRGYERGTFAYAPQYTPGGGTAALRAQLGILRNFFLAYRLAAMAPAPQLIHSPPPDGGSVRVLAEIGKQYAIYIHHGRVATGQKPQYVVDPKPQTTGFRLDMPAGSYHAKWIDTKTGRILANETFVHQGGERNLQSPVHREDVALRIFSAGGLPAGFPD